VRGRRARQPASTHHDGQGVDTIGGQEAARRSPELRTRFAPIPVQGDSPAGPSFRGGLTNSATISRSKRETPATRRLPAAPPGKATYLTADNQMTRKPNLALNAEKIIDPR